MKATKQTTLNLNAPCVRCNKEPRAKKSKKCFKCCKEDINSFVFIESERGFK